MNDLFIIFFLFHFTEKYTKPCDASAGDFNDCAKSSLETLLKSATKGERNVFQGCLKNSPGFKFTKSSLIFA